MRCAAGILCALLASAACHSTGTPTPPPKSVRVAVIPMENLTEDAATAGSSLTMLLLTKLDRSPVVSLVHSGDVERFLREERVRRNDDLTTDILVRLHTRLSVDYALLGAVHDYGYTAQAGEQVPLVGVSVHLVDCATGQAIWGHSHAREGKDLETVFGFGRIRSLSRLADLMASELVAELDGFFIEDRRTAVGADLAGVGPEGAPGAVDMGGAMPMDDGGGALSVGGKTAEERAERERARKETLDLWRQYSPTE